MNYEGASSSSLARVSNTYYYFGADVEPFAEDEDFTDMPPSKRATSADVARHAGVSRTTVSMVLNGNDASISIPTREKVMASVRELNYVPNTYAKTLRTTQSRVVLLPDLGDHDADKIRSFAPFLEQELSKAGLKLIREHESTGTARERAQRWSERRPWMVLSVPSVVDEDTARELYEHGVQQVLLVSDREVPYSSSALIVGDRVGALAAKHLISDLGHKSVAVLLPTHTVEVDFAEERFREFNGFATEHGATVQKVQASLNREGFNEIARRWRVEDSPVTAVYAHNDVYALVMIDALKANGFAVPDEISVIGTDNSQLARLFTPSLTSVGANSEAISHNMAREIVNLHRENTDDRRLLTCRIAAQVSIRESTANPRSK